MMLFAKKSRMVDGKGVDEGFPLAGLRVLFQLVQVLANHVQLHRPGPHGQGTLGHLALMLAKNNTGASMQDTRRALEIVRLDLWQVGTRSEERRVGKEGVRTCRSRWWTDHEKKKYEKK